MQAIAEPESVLDAPLFPIYDAMNGLGGGAPKRSLPPGAGNLRYATDPLTFMLQNFDADTADSQTALATVLKLFFLFALGDFENLAPVISFPLLRSYFHFCRPFQDCRQVLKMNLKQKSTNCAQPSGKSRNVLAKATAFVSS